MIVRFELHFQKVSMVTNIKYVANIGQTTKDVLHSRTVAVHTYNAIAEWPHSILTNFLLFKKKAHVLAKKINSFKKCLCLLLW